MDCSSLGLFWKLGSLLGHGNGISSISRTLEDLPQISGTHVPLPPYVFSQNGFRGWPQNANKTGFQSMVSTPYDPMEKLGSQPHLRGGERWIKATAGMGQIGGCLGIHFGVLVRLTQTCVTVGLQYLVLAYQFHAHFFPGKTTPMLLVKW